MLTADLLLARVDVGVIVAELKEPLDSTGRVLGSLSIVSVREGHDHSGSLEPLSLSRGDELIDDDLASVGEVSELG